VLIAKAIPDYGEAPNHVTSQVFRRPGTSLWALEKGNRIRRISTQWTQTTERVPRAGDSIAHSCRSQVVEAEDVKLHLVMEIIIFRRRRHCHARLNACFPSRRMIICTEDKQSIRDNSVAIIAAIALAVLLLIAG
jgi:hypothetical protein